MSTTIKGRAERGLGLGEIIGFPTLNIPYSGQISGVYVGMVTVNGKIYKAAVNVGKRPTIDNQILCESYLFDFNSKIEMGNEVEVELLQKIRDTKKFQNFDELKAQISKDVEFAKNWYNSHVC